MSSYRDDTHDIIAVSDVVWTTLHTLLEDVARVGDSNFGVLRHLVADTVVVNDAFVGTHIGVASDSVIVIDSVHTGATLQSSEHDKAKVVDAVFWRRKDIITDAITVGDAVFSGARQALIDTVAVGDAVFGQLHVSTLMHDNLRISDQLQLKQSDALTEDVVVSDSVWARSRVQQLVSEALLASDEVLLVPRQATLLLGDTIRASDQQWGMLSASVLLVDPVWLSDRVLDTDGQLHGLAWTAEVGDWQMSQYAPFGFHGGAVIDGVLYLTNPQGVFALDGVDETIDAHIKTGLVDMTSRNLAMPVEAHVAYELEGEATMDVTQTASGTPETYQYPMRARPVADALTTARFEFGRGLRGRHFAYTLRLHGQRAYVDDWNVLAAPSKRSL